MTNTEFVSRVQAIAASNPTYRTGGDGSDGTCDCIGLVMGAMGKKYPMHSTNYFARYETTDLLPIANAEIRVGDILYKARYDQSQLNARYKEGGRYYTGDLTDYYHVGVVESVNPEVVVHCTQSGNIDGIARDDNFDNWSYAGRVKGVEYDTPSETAYKATVTADSGSTVNLRKYPDKASASLARVPIGDMVDVYEEAQGWAKVSWQGVTGYMMSQYLEEPGMSLEDRVTVLEEMVAELYMLLGGDEDGA